MNKTPTRFHMNKALAPGPVELTVADLDRSLRYYTEAVGLHLLTCGPHAAQLGVLDRPLVVLQELPGVPPAPSSCPGLNHFALRVINRADLAHFAGHAATLGLEFDLRYHIVTESCYLSDPDGHGVEVYCERPSDEWRRENGLLVLVADPLDLQDLLSEPGADAPFSGLPPNTLMGHFQLKVVDSDLVASQTFYGEVLGFEVMSRLGDRLLAFGVGDDRSQLVLTNRFSRDGGEPAPEASAHLIGIDLLLPGPGDVEALASHLAASGHPYQLQAGVLSVRDPSGNLLRFTGSYSPVRE